MLKKSLYGLKQDPRALYAKMDIFLISQGFERWKSDPNVYLQHFDDSISIIVFHFDDILIIGSWISDMGLVIYSLHSAFSMTDWHCSLVSEFLFHTVLRMLCQIIVSWGISWIIDLVVNQNFTKIERVWERGLVRVSISEREIERGGQM